MKGRCRGISWEISRDTSSTRICTVAVQERDWRATTLQCNIKRTFSSHFTLHSSHPALQASHLHFTFHSSSYLKSSDFFSPGVTSSDLFSSHPIPSHMSSKQVLLNYFHVIRALKKVHLNSSQLRCTPESSYRQSLHKVLPSTTSYYKACTKHFPVLRRTTKLAQSMSQYYSVLQSLHKVLPATHTRTHHSHTTYPHTQLTHTHTQLTHTQPTHTHTHTTYPHATNSHTTYSHTTYSHTTYHTKLTHTHTTYTDTHTQLTHTLLTHTHTQLTHTHNFLHTTFLNTTYSHKTYSHTTYTHTHHLPTHNLLSHKLLTHTTHKLHTLDRNWSFIGSVGNWIPYMQNQTRLRTEGVLYEVFIGNSV